MVKISQFFKISNYSNNISKESSGHYVVRKNEQGKLCGLRFCIGFLHFELSFLTFILSDFFKLNFLFFKYMFSSGPDWTRCLAARVPGWRTTLRKIRFSLYFDNPENSDDFDDNFNYDVQVKRIWDMIWSTLPSLSVYQIICFIYLIKKIPVSFGDAWLSTGGDQI